MNIVVVGCGALGQLFMHGFLKCGHHVSGWQRKNTSSLSLQFVTTNQERCNRVITTNAPRALRHCQLLLVITKAQDVQPALTNLMANLPAHCPIILVHNGLGVAEQLGRVTQPLLLAVITHAVSKTENGYLHTAKGHTDLGPLNDAAQTAQELVHVLNTVLPTVSWHDNIIPQALTKLAINCVINPLAVKYHCKNGELLQYSNEIGLLCQEMGPVLNGSGLLLDVEQIYQRVLSVINLTASNTCSMLQDIKSSRRTEIEFITGYLLRQAAEMGQSLPLHHALYQDIKIKEAYYAH